ncbi:MAG: hypothetical protein ABJO01_15950 [Parasphingorhabdus sp.]|uniref:hypothetical protein n=1 Tax=Parasphingorhabdus sp. TaxID=2709688 RepID=UPI003298887E
MTHNPFKFATFKALPNETTLSPEADIAGENCVNFGAVKGSRRRNITPVICVNFERLDYKIGNDSLCSARVAEPRTTVAPFNPGLRNTYGAQKLEAGEKHSEKCVNFGAGNMMHQAQS